MPLPRGYEDEYSLFLADLNNYMNECNSSQRLLSCQRIRKGEVRCKHQFLQTYIIQNHPCNQTYSI